ncbi:dienelactone hydrolase family protein [Colwellia psychrerythraea]|uniref:Dienelactone hydrolase domain-containing protein n=1 Tax=Colwellia psychrerythraea TaxID=28229 RepID=A0A099KLX4_COLPS|nr:dienelactone hydrolase family protein [Colwellia psychrerythraea]KGJ91466.1 hypothetical protein ND2E_3331 [Colwellia psychrerythraea]
MSIILVSDVFGLTPALLKISEKLGASHIVEPYEGQMMGFNTEAEAYEYFVKTVGLDNYLAHLVNEVEAIEQQTILIGFSVGASITWRLSEATINPLINKAYCFYGSQIRNFTQVEPRFEVHLIFPKNEPHFDVVELQNSLARKTKVNTERVEYLHGFMNSHSTNYDNSGYTRYINFLRSINNKYAIKEDNFVNLTII